MKTPISELPPDQKKRLRRLFDHVLPKSYKGRFNAAYRGAVADLELFKKHNPTQRYPTNSADGFLRWVGTSDIAPSMTNVLAGVCQFVSEWVK